MKKSIIFLAPIFLIGLLYFLSRKNDLSGDFKRVYFPKIILKSKKIIVLPGEDINGLSYFGNELWLKCRNKLISFDSVSTNKRIIPIKVGENSSLVNFSISKNKLFYYVANSSEICVRDLITNLTTKLKFKFPIIDFLIVDNQLVVTEVDRISSYLTFHLFADNKLVRLNNLNIYNYEGGAVAFSGKFVNIGKSCLFVPFYSDSILIIDSLFNFRRINNIDRLNVKTNIIKVGNRYSIDPNTRLLRLGSGYANDIFFVSSYVKAQNEKSRLHEKGTVIDLYNVKSNNYLRSFILPDINGKGVDDFSISDDFILSALHGNNIVLYDLKPIFPKK